MDTLKASEAGATDLGLDVFNNTFDDALSHPAIASRQRGTEELARECQSCHLVAVCGGGYLPHRFSEAAGFDNPSVYCEDLMFLINHVQQSMTTFGYLENQASELAS